MKIYQANNIIRILSRSALVSLCVIVFASTASAYWIWTPETKKFINPKYAVKDTPKEQFDWAMSFYNAKDYKRSAIEFEKLAKQYEFSEYASKAQYYAGLSYEDMGKPYMAFQAYQKAIDNFPHIENIDEIISREFKIANMYAEKDNPKILGTDIMTSTDRAIEIYRRVVDNAPFGPIADEAQYRTGEVMKRAGMYEEATVTFQKLIDEYPQSKFADKAQYEVAQCAYRASLQPAYDIGPTDRALRIFEDYAASGQDEKLSEDAKRTMRRLKDRAAQKSMLTAEFYEKMRHPKSAIIYYQDVLDRYPESIHAPLAQAKIEELKTVKTGTDGIFGWFVKQAPEDTYVPAKKAWKPIRLFGKKAPAVPAAEPSAQSAQAVAAAPGQAAAGAPSVSQSIPAAKAPADKPAKKKYWDFMGILGTNYVAPKQIAPYSAPAVATAPQVAVPPISPEPSVAAQTAAATAASAAPVSAAAAAPAADNYEVPVAREDKGIVRASPTGDDPNVEYDEDRI
jgi:outer membrane protein assembly factor BamD